MLTSKQLGNTSQLGADQTQTKTIKDNSYFRMSKSQIKDRTSSIFRHRPIKLVVKECRVTQGIRSLRKRKCKACSQLRTK